MIRPLLRLAAVAACGLVVSGCITLLPKSKPAQLYRFGQPVATEAGKPLERTIGVYRANGSFQGESSGDRLLTVTGGKAAYIAESRWVAPAATLFDEAVFGAFDSSTGNVRLIARGEQGVPAYALRLDVRNFEADYNAGASAPTVVVRVKAALTRRDQTTAGAQIFESRVTATDNRVTAIVAAYEQALREVLTKLVAWTEQTAI